MRYEIKKDKRSHQERRKLSSASSTVDRSMVNERIKERRAKSPSAQIVTAKHICIYS